MKRSLIALSPLLQDAWRLDHRTEAQREYDEKVRRSLEAQGMPRDPQGALRWLAEKQDDYSTSQPKGLPWATTPPC